MNWHDPPLLRSAVLVTLLALAPDCESREDPRAGVETGADNVAVDALFADWNLPAAPGCALAVSQNGALLYARGYGYANLDYDIPVTPQTVFDVASVTKQFVAASLTMLELESKLSLDDDVRRWLPELPAYEWPVTLRHMVHHTSGLRDYLNLFPLAGRDDYYPISHAQILAMMSRQRSLNFQPGARYEYSNTAYMLLAQVIERVSGQSLGEFTAGRIFGPLGMEGSLMYDNLEMIIPRRATGYARDGAGRPRSVHNWNFDVAGDGQLYTTVEDLLRWDAYLHGAEAPAIHELMVTDGYLNNGEPIGYARGIELGQYRGLRTLEHSGSSWGFRSQLIRFPDTGLAIAIACNSDHARPVELSQRVADHYLADQLGPERVDDEDSTHEQGAEAEIEPPALTTGQLREFAGVFFSPELDATYRINVAEGALQLRIEQEPPLAVEPMASDAFTFGFQPQGWSEPEAVRLDFRRDENGAITGFWLSAGRERDIVFERREPAGVVIVNARVIDGSGGPSRSARVRIVGDRIAAVGNFEPSAVDTVVDAHGLALAPGFIDTHSHHEDGLFDTPGALAAVSQGITTIAAGQDGRQQFPLAEFFARLEAAPAAINVASYAGHGTLRDRVMGEDYRRHATPEEVTLMADLLRAEMQAGALGLSLGLEYDPGSFSATEELVELARVVAAQGGHVICHIRSEDQYFWEAVEEVITIGREAAVPVRVTHVKLAMTRWWGQAGRLTALLDEARAAGVDVTADLYSYPYWNSGFSWLTTLFPERDLDRRDGAEYILRDMLSPQGILLAKYNPEPAYGGMTIAGIAELRGEDPEATLMDLLKAEMHPNGEGSGSQILAFAMDEPDIEAIMAWPHAVIGSDGELAGVHPRGFGAFTRFLGHYVRERQVVSLEEGVRKITALPARQAGIPERGSIREGHFADLVLFDPDRIANRARPDDPRAPSVGVAKVWVNGRVVFEDDRVTGQRPGRPIRHQP